MNQNIQHIINLEFETKLMKGINPGVYYILVSCEDTKLQQLCKEKNMKMKLLDSYDYQNYDTINKTKFEPFRSK